MEISNIIALIVAVGAFVPSMLALREQRNLRNAQTKKARAEANHLASLAYSELVEDLRAELVRLDKRTQTKITQQEKRICELEHRIEALESENKQLRADNLSLVAELARGALPNAQS